MSQDRTLARGARVFGAVLIAALALISLGWIIRDFTKANEVTDVWWNWTGLLARSEDGIWVASFIEPMLLLLYAVAAVTAVRSSSATGILIGTGVLTVVLRTPGLWNLNADWMQGVSDGLMSKVLSSTVAAVAIGAVLIVTAIAGRRPTQPPPGGYGYGFPPPTDPAEEPPARPTRSGAIAAFLMLGSGAAVLAAWEIRTWERAGWDRYERMLTGERSIIRLLDVPPAWATWTVVLVALVAAVGALAGAPFSRPLGLIVAAPLLAFGVSAVAYALKIDMIEHFAEVSIEERLRLLTNVFEVVVGAAVLLVLARGERGDPQTVSDYRGRAAAPYAASPPSS
ncbi:hypothetical protein OG533_25125 [Streptomyces sp. NBC_01186]|uniref:hypothetical protein n=1 Tax=Streptomyces sp. NBC_01186 TaxID=2903765 RepID=UPI002E132D1D|nr:hypothetical protein OG533_25125 [Streptomyces sp. NBC_01186]